MAMGTRKDRERQEDLYLFSVLIPPQESYLPRFCSAVICKHGIVGGGKRSATAGSCRVAIQSRALGAPGAGVVRRSAGGATRRQASGRSVFATTAESPSQQTGQEGRNQIWLPQSPADSPCDRPNAGSRTAGLLSALRRGVGTDPY